MANHARRLVAKNGMEDVVEVIQCSVEDLELDGKVRERQEGKDAFRCCRFLSFFFATTGCADIHHYCRNGAGYGTGEMRPFFSACSPDSGNIAFGKYLIRESSENTYSYGVRLLAPLRLSRKRALKDDRIRVR